MPYSVIIFKDFQQGTDIGVASKEVKRFNARTLAEAKKIFDHNLNNLNWSRQHKLDLGLNPKDVGHIQLFDHDAGWELEERGYG